MAKNRPPVKKSITEVLQEVTDHGASPRGFQAVTAMRSPPETTALVSRCSVRR